MPNETLERIIEEVKQLSDEEQRQLRRMLDSWHPVPPEVTAEQKALLLQRLLEDGVISALPTGDHLRPEPDAIHVQGRPVSETLLEDRG